MKHDALYFANFIGLIVGTFGCVGVIYTISFHSKFKNFSNKLILLQTSCLLLDNLVLLVLPQKEYISCTISGTLHLYFWIAAMLWSCIMNHVLWKICTQSLSEILLYHAEENMTYFHLFCWIGAIPLAVTVLTTGYDICLNSPL
jgi:hypothetical protein